MSASETGKKAERCARCYENDPSRLELYPDGRTLCPAHAYLEGHSKWHGTRGAMLAEERGEDS